MAGHVPLLNSKATSMSLTLPSTSVQAEVIGERINQVGGYGLEIPALYHFYGYESGINWLKYRLETICKNIEKYIKHCLKGAAKLYFTQ